MIVGVAFAQVGFGARTTAVATPNGKVPTPMVSVTVLSEVSITDTVLA